VPEILKNLERSHPAAGGRLDHTPKSAHFAAYDRVTTEFAELIGIDPG
jgi:hypothetical protein